VLALLVKLKLLQKEDQISFDVSLFVLKEYQNLIQAIVAGVLYISLLLEIVHQTEYYYNHDAVRNIVVVCYHFTFILLLSYYYDKQNLPQFIKVKLALYCISILMIFLSNINIITIRNEVLKYNAPLQIFFFMHLYIVGIGTYFIFKLHQLVKIVLSNKAEELKFLYWLTVLLLIATASSELDHIVVYSFYNKQNSISYLLTQNHKFGYAILWGATAFVLINIGMKRKIREIRIISLALFTLVILKLFVYDINNISEAGRIVAFVLLGVLLLVVSFMYQRLKKLISVDHTVNNNENDKSDESN
jgi:uncharacterized membrane protein